MKFTFLGILLLITTFTFGQNDSIDFSLYRIDLDSLVVTATRSGFSVEDFVDMVQKDESFHEAFHNIRTLSYSSENEIKMYDKKQREKATYHSITQQNSDGDCRTMETFNELVSGNFYKRKKNIRYYTAKMYDRIFFTHGKICETERKKSSNPKGMEKNIAELKKLIFSPGKKTDVPIIGKKTAIFDKEMLPYYNMSISSKKYQSSIDCYVFTAVVKPEIKKGKTIIKFLETYFDKTTFQVIARNYHLKYSGSLFDFDVKMDIKLKKLGQKYLPEFIKYDGNWDVPAKKRETSKFTIRFYDYN